MRWVWGVEPGVRWASRAVCARVLGVLAVAAGLVVVAVIAPVPVAAALLTGFFNTAGGGGAVITFLALSAAGVPPLTAHATSQVITPFSFLGGVGLVREYRPDRRWVIAGAVGAVAGVVILAVTPPATFQTVAPWCLLPAAVLVVVGEPVRRLVRRTGRMLGPTATVGAVFVCGVYAGMIGIGSGTLAVAVLALVPTFLCMPLPALMRIRNSLLLIMALVVAGAFAVTGLADWTLVATLVLPAAVGGWVGTKVLGHAPVWLLKSVIVVTALAGSVWMVSR